MRRWPQPIQHKAQLLVEGKDSEGFFEAMARHLKVEGIQIQDFGGITDLQKFLHAFVRLSDFSQVTNIGIVRDAEDSAQGALRSVKDALRHAGLPVPGTTAPQESRRLNVSVMVLPGGDRSGMLESLLWETIPDNMQDCIDTFLRCAEDVRGESVQRRHKARAGAYLSTQRKPQLSVGDAARRTYWDLDHPTLEQVRRFVREFCSTG